jgi:hypothetical protein
MSDVNTTASAGGYHLKIQDNSISLLNSPGLLSGLMPDIAPAGALSKMERWKDGKMERQENYSHPHY